MTARRIPFIDLDAQRRRLGAGLDAAIARVLERGDFIQGKEVRALEEKLAEFANVPHCVTCGNGTDAMTLVALAEGFGPGDAVFVPAFTYVASAEAFRVLGITTFFVDVEENGFGIDTKSLERAITQVRKAGITPRMIVAVDLFGEPCDYSALRTVAEREGLILLSDAAQSFGALYNNARVGALADYTTTSFFPSKPLGAYGDGGAIFTRGAEKAALLRSLSQHGKGEDKYDNRMIGLNSRLDTLQAAVLLEKLAILPEELEARELVAQFYSQGLDSRAKAPMIRKEARSAWAQYTIILPDGARRTVQDALSKSGVPTAVYYPIPLNRQTGYLDCPVVSEGVPRSDALAGTVLSLPMHPYLDAETQGYILTCLSAALDQAHAD